MVFAVVVVMRSNRLFDGVAGSTTELRYSPREGQVGCFRMSCGATLWHQNLNTSCLRVRMTLTDSTARRALGRAHSLCTCHLLTAADLLDRPFDHVRGAEAAGLFRECQGGGLALEAVLKHRKGSGCHLLNFGRCAFQRPPASAGSAPPRCCPASHAPALG